MAYYDEEGNIVEGALSPDEAKALREENEARTREIEETKQRLAKLENKDFNFRKLENMTQEEIAKLSARELEVQKQMEALQEKTHEFTQKQIDAAKKSALSKLAGADQELQTRILSNYDRIKDEAVTEEEITNKMIEAYTLTTGSGPSVNPLAQAMGFSGMGLPPTEQDKSFADTERGKELAASLGMNIAKQDSK